MSKRKPGGNGKRKPGRPKLDPKDWTPPAPMRMEGKRALLLSVDRAVSRAAKVKAAQTGISVSEYVEMALIRWLEGE